MTRQLELAKTQCCHVRKTERLDNQRQTNQETRRLYLTGNYRNYSIVNSFSLNHGPRQRVTTNSNSLGACLQQLGGKQITETDLNYTHFFLTINALRDLDN